MLARRFTFLLLSLVPSLLILPAGAQQPESRQPTVLILGDSISIGYTPYVREMMEAEAVVVRPTKGGRNENCQGTTHGVTEIERWLKLEGRPWDVIHFNFGLHDLKRVDPTTRANSNDPRDPRQAEPEQYKKQLRQIVAKLKTTNAKLIFATTTPVPEGGVKPHRDVEDPQRYNAIARKIMQEEGIAINDLYAVCEPRLAELQKPVNVHFTAEGSRLLAEHVVKHLRAALAD